MRRGAFVLLLLLWTPAAAKKSDWRVPPAAARARNPIGADAASLKEGRRLWDAHCAACHGSTGRGNGPEAPRLEKAVPDLTDRELLPAQTDGELWRKVWAGRRPMPGYKKTLSETQLWHLVNFMRALERAK